MKRLTYRDEEGLPHWSEELMEDNTGWAGELIRSTVADLEDAIGDCSIDRLQELAKADKHGRIAKMPFVAMIEQSLKSGEMKPKTDQRFNGRYAVVYSGKGKRGCPLIDICGTPYNSGEAEERRKQLAKEADHE